MIKDFWDNQDIVNKSLIICIFLLLIYWGVINLV